jgi:UDP-N-acetylglucosamine--N-acetylmuramyl-(pentapeptide) pyrophosphoryl-undecaprenol N-acetylglucosamine transferase
MRLAITGGGTGGHVYPALEIASEARKRGWDVRYYGSLRGQEGRLCAQTGIPFTGFSSYPFYSLRTLMGWKARTFFVGATIQAQMALKKFAPDVLFSTGGYSSAPVVSAAKRLKIPYILHEQNSYPGRTNVILSKHAFAVTTVFGGVEKYFPHARIVRTGMPVRSELRAIARNSPRLREQSQSPRILVMGGSQGAAALNDIAMVTAMRMSQMPLEWVHITGKAHFEKNVATMKKFGLGTNYHLKAFLDTEELGQVLSCCDLAITRSGAGAIADLVAFRIPAIYVPYPSAFGDHQYKNAEEIENLGGGSVIRQETLTPSILETVIKLWLHDPQKRQRAQEALATWDQENAVNKVISLIEEAASNPVGAQFL